MLIENLLTLVKKLKKIFDFIKAKNKINKKVYIYLVFLLVFIIKLYFYLIFIPNLILSLVIIGIKLTKKELNIRIAKLVVHKELISFLIW